MKKIHLFAGANYYPLPAMENYLGLFETAEEALTFARAHDDEVEWAQLASANPDGLLVKLGEWMRARDGGWVERPDGE